MEKLKKALENGKAIFGFKKTLNGLKNGEISAVVLAKNCSEEMREEVKSFGVEIIVLNVDSDEVALICKRQHNISVIGILK